MSYQIRKVLTTNVDDVSIIIDAKISKHEETGVVYEIIKVWAKEDILLVNLTQLCFNHPMVDMLDAIDWEKEYEMMAEEEYDCVGKELFGTEGSGND